MPELHDHIVDIRAQAAAAVTSPSSPVGLLVHRPAVAVAGDAPVQAAAALMRELDVSALLVDEGEAIVTERDIARGVAAGFPLDADVRSLASPHPVAVGCTMPIVRAAGLMLNEHVRHLVVQLDGDAVGIVSLRDLVAVMLQTADPELWLTSLRVAISTTPSETWIG